MSIVRVGMAENKDYAAGYAAIFGKKKPADPATPTGGPAAGEPPVPPSAEAPTSAPGTPPVPSPS